MDNKKKKLLTSTIIASAVMGTASLSANTNTLFSFDELGSGSEIRTTLATQSISDNANANYTDAFRLEMKCGDENKDKKAESKSESKSKDAKCGEGKCGSSKDKSKTAKSDTTKKSESKSKDAKCGEGKCGN